MDESRRFRLRCRFKKTGRLVYLSHLEITRALERIVRRSGLPFATTNGFSPHMKIAFGSALAVGIGGVSEVFDVVLTRYVPPHEAQDRLERASAGSLEVFSASYIDNSAPAASVAYPRSTYEVVFDRNVDELVFPERIAVTKKKKVKELIVDDFLSDEPVLTGDTLVFSLTARDSGSLRADVFIEETLRASEDALCGFERPRILSVMRTDQEALS